MHTMPLEWNWFGEELNQFLQLITTMINLLMHMSDIFSGSLIPHCVFSYFTS